MLEGRHVQRSHTQDDVTYASLRWRFAATVIDMFIVFCIVVLALMVAMAAGALDIAQYRQMTWPPQSLPRWAEFVMYGVLFAYYTLFELRGATPGKRICGLRVTMDDGQTPSTSAIAVRNLVRIPEFMFLYIPSAISCLANPSKKRLGDFAARTVVVRQVGTPLGARLEEGRVAPLPASARDLSTPIPSPLATGAATHGSELPGSPVATLADAVATLKTAALAVKGAHLSYLRFSEAELAKGAGEPASSPAASADTAPVREPDYAPEYAAAWYTLTDAVMALQRARAAADDAAAQARTTLHAASAAQPDLVHLCRELAPYFASASDEQVHEAFLRVARGETL
jgi:uncharacterized RDD family membrane protein YckC